MREIKYIVDEKTISPQSRKWGGNQYENNVTKVVFEMGTSLTDLLEKNIGVRIDFNSASAGYDPSPNLAIEGISVSREIPYKYTRYGGEIEATLVITELDENNAEIRTLLSKTATIYFTSVSRGKQSEKVVYENISAFEAKVRQDIADGIYNGKDGEQGEKGEKGDKGEKGEQGPQGVSGVYVGSGDMPEGYNVQIDPSGEATGGGSGSSGEWDDSSKLLFTESKFEYIDTGSGEELVNTTGGGDVFISNHASDINANSGYVQIGNETLAEMGYENFSKLTNQSLKIKNHADGSVVVDGENGLSMSNEGDMYGSKFYFDILTLYNNVTENDSRAEVKMTPTTITHREELYSDGSVNTKSATWQDLISTPSKIGDIETALDNIIAIQNTLIGGEA